MDAFRELPEIHQVETRLILNDERLRSRNAGSYILYVFNRRIMQDVELTEYEKMYFMKRSKHAYRVRSELHLREMYCKKKECQDQGLPVVAVVWAEDMPFSEPQDVDGKWVKDESGESNGRCKEMLGVTSRVPGNVEQVCSNDTEDMRLL